MSPGEASLREEIKKTSAEWPRYGYRRITEQLRRGKWRVNRKRVQRLMRDMSIQARIKRKKRRTTNSERGFPCYPNLVLGLEINYPEQVWVSDITYIHLRNGFVYLAVIDDVYAHKRIHSSLSYLTPAEFEAQWRAEHVLALEVELKSA